MKIIDTFAFTLTKEGSRLKKTLIEKEIIEEEGEIITLADPVFEIWFKKEYM